MDFNLSRNNQFLANDLVLIDGFSSSGKSLVASMFGYFERSEIWQLDYFFEQQAILHYFDKVSIDSLNTLLQIKSDELIYNLYIGRNINFRTSDLTSPFYTGLQKKYLDRSESLVSDRISISNEIINSKPILPLHIHNIFGYSKIFFDAFQDRLKMYIVMMRDPFYLINRWHEGLWVSRIGNDISEFQLCFKFKNKYLPWFVKEYAEEYIEANDLEKSILTIYHFYKKVFLMYENLKPREKEKTQIIFFNDFINYTDFHINKICENLNTSRRDNFTNIMIQMSVPRQSSLPTSSIDTFISNNSEFISLKFRKMSEELSDLYLNFYLLNKIV